MLTNTQVERRTDSKTLQDVDTSASGNINGESGTVGVVLDDLREIESPADVTVSAYGGYSCSVRSVDGNEVTVRLFYGGGAGAELDAVSSGTDVTDVHFHAEGY